MFRKSPHVRLRVHQALGSQVDTFEKPGFECVISIVRSFLSPSCLTLQAWVLCVWFRIKFKNCLYPCFLPLKSSFTVVGKILSSQHVPVSAIFGDSGREETKNPQIRVLTIVFGLPGRFITRWGY